MLIVMRYSLSLSLLLSFYLSPCLSFFLSASLSFSLRLFLSSQEKASAIQHYQSVMTKKQRDFQQALDKSKKARADQCKELQDRVELVSIVFVCGLIHFTVFLPHSYVQFLIHHQLPVLLYLFYIFWGPDSLTLPSLISSLF